MRSLSEPLPDRRVDHDVHGGVVGVRRDLGPLVPQPDHALRDRVLDDLLQKPLEEVAEAGLGKRARHKLDALLSAGDEEADTLLGGRLQRLRVEPLRLLGDAGAPVGDEIEVLEELDRYLPRRGHLQLGDRRRILDPDDRAELVVPDVVHVGHGIDDDEPRQDGRGERVERVAQDVRLDVLQVVDLLGYGMTDGRMRLWIRAKKSELRASCRLVHDNAVAIADRADLAQLRNAVAILVDADVPLAVMNHRIALGGVPGADHELLEPPGIAHGLLGGGEAGSGAVVVLEDVGGVAHLNELREGDKTFVADKRRRRNMLRLA
jgi:hypothetical protein